jgi:hypothetical protein
MKTIPIVPMVIGIAFKKASRQTLSKKWLMTTLIMPT